jgi:hypothetical protein
MGVVNLLHEVGYRELQLMQPKPAGLVAGRKLQPRPKIKQDLGHLRDDELARLQERRRERRMLVAPAVHHRQHAVHAGLRAGDVIVSGAGVLQRQPHEFAAALDSRPIEQLIAHAVPRHVEPAQVAGIDVFLRGIQATRRWPAQGRP